MIVAIVAHCPVSKVAKTFGCPVAAVAKTFGPGEIMYVATVFAMLVPADGTRANELR